MKSESSPQRLSSQPSTPQPTKKELVEEVPSFGPTEYKHNIVSIDRHTTIDVRLHTKIDRGFFLADNDWTCYRRNYFQVSGSFSLEGIGMLYEGQEIPCLAKDQNGNLEPIQFFMLGVSARLSDCDKPIQLIQHTPKRDKGPQIIPVPKPIRPGGNVGFSSVGSSQSIATFERLQFKNATANNGKRRAAQQYYVIVVELLVKLLNGNVVTVAVTNSAPLVVRGRSPGHYADADNGVTRQPYRHHSGGPIIHQHQQQQPQQPHPYQRAYSVTPTNEYPPYTYTYAPSYPSPSIPMMQHHYRTSSNDSTYPEKPSPYYWQRPDVYNQDQQERMRIASNQSSTSIESHSRQEYYSYGQQQQHPYQPMTQSGLPPLPSNPPQDHYYQQQQYDWRNNKAPSTYSFENNNTEERQSSPPPPTSTTSPLSSIKREPTIVK